MPCGIPCRVGYHAVRDTMQTVVGYLCDNELVVFTTCKPAMRPSEYSFFILLNVLLMQARPLRAIAHAGMGVSHVRCYPTRQGRTCLSYSPTRALINRMHAACKRESPHRAMRRDGRIDRAPARTRRRVKSE